MTNCLALAAPEKMTRKPGKDLIKLYLDLPS